MKKIYLLLLLVIFPLILFCQTRFTVTKPRLELSNENLIIEYNILNTDPSDLFEVWIEVTNASGFMINAQSLSGDVGEDITGGSNKRILWNLANDNILLDEEIYVEIRAEMMKPQIGITDAEKYQFKIQRDGLMILGVGAGVSSIIFRFKANRYIDQQNMAPNYDEYELAGKNADTYYTLSYISGGVAVVSIGLAAYQYIRGDKSGSNKNSLRIAPAYDHGVVLAWTRKF